jgi:5-methylcytosine-specific restriction endonuclease McrA
MARDEFSRTTQKDALARQRYRCASCGVHISCIGEAGRATHRFGEGAQAHHVVHAKFGGKGTLDNCVIICRACHYSVHEGGNYTHGTVVGRRSDFPYFKPSRGSRE